MYSNLNLDVIPLDVIYDIYSHQGYDVELLLDIDEFMKSGDYFKLIDVLVGCGNKIQDITDFISTLDYTTIDITYDIPLRDHLKFAVKFYLDSFDNKEQYRFFMCHIFCAILICKHRPELNIYRHRQ